MSVKFQESTKTKVTEAATAATAAAQKAGDKSNDLSHKVGEYLTGGETGKGYLAVRDRCARRVTTLVLTSYRHTLSSFKPTHFEPRCSHRVHWLACKKS